jgi:hypothetical protein
MSEQPQSTVVPATPPAPVINIIDAGKLVEEAIRELPGLSAVKSQLTLLAALYAQDVHPPFGKVEPADAIKDLEAFFGSNLGGVKRALGTVRVTNKKLAAGLASVVQEETGRQLDPDTLGLESISSSEIAEQTVNTQAASQILADCKDLLRLPIRDLYDEMQKAKQAQVAPPVRKGLLSGVQRMLEIQGARMKLYVPEAQSPAETEQLPDPDWKTPPVLDMNDKNTKMMVAVLQRAAQTMRQFEASGAPNWQKLTLQAIANWNWQQEKLEGLIGTLKNMALEQHEQSAKIEANVDNDVKKFKVTIDAIFEIRAMCEEIMRYFGLTPRDVDFTTIA